MPPKAGQSNKDSVEALLSDLDNLGTAEPSPRPSTSSAKSASQQQSSGPRDDAQSLLDDLDNLVQRRAPTPRKQQQQQLPDLGSNTPSSIAGTSEPGVKPSPATSAAQALEQTPTSNQEAQGDATPSFTTAASSAPAGGGWGSWGSVWSSAAKLADQARAEIEKRAQSEQARDLSQRGWHLTQGVREFVKEAGLEKLGEDLTKVGKKGWTEVINAVAPPISAHEIIQVTLSHDMIGFDGIPDVTFKVLARVMESQQVGRGTDQQLIVNKSAAQQSEERASPSSQHENDSVGQDMKAVDGYEKGWTLADSALTELINTHVSETPKATSVTVPITHCPVFLRIQPVVSPLPGSSSISRPTADSTTTAEGERYVSFLLSLQDPNNGLSHRTCSQTFPHSWLSQSFEENPWIEQALLDVLEGALGIIGQEYINGRQSGRSRSVIPEEVSLPQVVQD